MQVAAPDRTIMTIVTAKTTAARAQNNHTVSLVGGPGRPRLRAARASARGLSTFFTIIIFFS
jgi:hypothetical protein